MRSYPTFFLAAVLLFPLCLYGCASKPSPPRAGPDAGRILASLKQCKDHLESFRGVGRFKAFRGAGAKSFRIAWIGSQPQSLRVETLGPWGQPVATFVINGYSLFFHSRQDNKYFKGDATVRNLSRFVSVPVRAEDLFGLLSGQPPVIAFHHAKIRASRGEGGWLLSLYKKWGRLIEKIWLADDAKTVERVEVFDGRDNLEYRIQFSDFHQVESICLPHRIAISDQEGPLWVLTVEKFWTNVSIPDGAYTLEVPEARVMDADPTTP